MAVVVTDTRTTITNAENTTGWTGSGGTSNTVVMEGTNSVVSTFNITTGQVYFTTTARNVSNTLIYIWSNNFAQQGSWLDANPAHAMHLGDGTDRVSFKMAGGDRKTFTHLEVAPDWDCLVLDGSQASTMNTNGLTVARAGSFANLNLAAITQFGSDFTTQSKGLGGGINVAVDIIRIGNDGLVVTGGTTGDRGNFLEVSTEDGSTAANKAHGVIRELITGVYGLQGPLTFGAATGNSWFEDSGIVIAFENRNISNDKYYLKVQGGTGETHFILRNSTITTAGPFARLEFNTNSVNTFTFTGNTVTEISSTVQFGTDTAAQSHVVTGNAFQGCGRISPGVVEFRNNTISNSTDTGGAMLLTDTTQMSGITFQSGGTGHAILITSPGTYVLSNFIFTGYGADGTTNAAIYNNSGGSVTLQVSGGSGISVTNGTGATTTVQNTQTFSVTGLVAGSEVRVYRKSDGVELAGVESSGTTFSFQYNYTGDVDVDVYIHNIQYVWLGISSTLTSNGVTIPVQQRFDRNYSNPV
jgi:hypothetical protein